MNGVFQPVTVIDTIIFGKAKDLLMWQTTVWGTLKLHSSHCLQLYAWHDRLAHSKKKKKGGEENSSNLCWWKHGFPSEQWFCFGLTVEKKEQVTWPAQKIWELQFARGQVSCLGSIELYFCPVLIAFPGHRHSRVWAEKGPGWMLAGRDYHESPCLPTIPQLSTATHALLWHIYRISTKQLSRTVTD